MNFSIFFKANRTAVLGGVAVVLAVLTYLDYTAESASSTAPVSRSPRAGAAPSASAGLAPAATGLRAGQSSASAAWQEIRTLSRLRENAPAVTRRYQALAAPYAEMMAEVAVLHGAGEKPEAAAKRALGALIPPEVQVKALLVAEGAAVRDGNTLLTVNLSLESQDSRAMQLAVMALGNPTAGLVWRELALSADSDKRMIQATGLLSVLAIRYAE